MRKTIKGFVAGVIFMLLLSGITVFATSRTETINVSFSGIRLVIHGTPTIPRDAAGNVVEPFIWQGTTFLPVRAISVALGYEVQWDGATQTVYIGAMPAQTITTHLFRQPYTDIGNSRWFSVWGDERDNGMVLVSFNLTSASGVGVHNNHVVFPLDMTANTVFHATLSPPTINEITKVYRVYGDGRLLYTSPIMRNAMNPIDVEVDVSGVMNLRIEVEVTANPVGLRGFWPADFGNIQNARIIQTP